MDERLTTEDAQIEKIVELLEQIVEDITPPEEES